MDEKIKEFYKEKFGHLKDISENHFDSFFDSDVTKNNFILKNKHEKVIFNFHFLNELKNKDIALFYKVCTIDNKYNNEYNFIFKIKNNYFSITTQPQIIFDIKKALNFATRAIYSKNIFIVSNINNNEGGTNFTQKEEVIELIGTETYCKIINFILKEENLSLKNLLYRKY